LNHPAGLALIAFFINRLDESARRFKLNHRATRATSRSRHIELYWQIYGSPLYFHFRIFNIGIGVREEIRESARWKPSRR
jgi:hypothetical protein